MHEYCGILRGRRHRWRQGGKTLAIDLGKHGVRTALIERDPNLIGGSCINLACIPTKTFIESANVAHRASHAMAYGIGVGRPTVDWLAVRHRVAEVVTSMRRMNHELFTSAPALDFILGRARFAGPRRVEVTTPDGTVRALTAAKIFINTGSRPAVPTIEGLSADDILDSISVQRLAALPSHLLILGGGYVALEFAQLFRRFGCEVTIAARGTQLLSREDPDVATAVAEMLQGEGIKVLLNSTVTGGARRAGAIVVEVDHAGKELHLAGSHLLAATGRAPNSEDLHLAAAGVRTDDRGFIEVNERLETSAPDIWALGDCNGGPQFTHASLDDYRIVKANVFRGGARSTKDRLVPASLFTDPELARVGLTEIEARRRGLEIRIACVPVSVVPRAKTSGRTTGLLKAIVDAKTERILGCAIFAAQAGEAISTVQMAMTANLPHTALRDAVLAHPTMTEGLNNLFGAL